MRVGPLLLGIVLAGCASDRHPNGAPQPPATPPVTVVVAPPPAAPAASPVAVVAAPAPVAPVVSAPPGSVAIVPEIGLPGLPVGKSTRKDFVARLGAPASVEKHGSYSVELHYPQGIDATFCQGDAAETIFWVSFRPPFVGHVAHAGQVLVLGKTTARQALTMFPAEDPWRTTQGSDTWWMELPQPDDRALELYVNRDLSVPQFPLDEARHLDRPIVEISVSVSSTDCEGTFGAKAP